MNLRTLVELAEAIESEKYIQGNLPPLADGTRPEAFGLVVKYIEHNEGRGKRGELTRLDLYGDQMALMSASELDSELRRRLVRHAAMAMVWVEAIDQRARKS